MPSAGGCGWWPPHDSVEGFGLARAFSYVRFPSGPEGRVSREARTGDARTRCRPVSRGRLFAPVSPARDPVPAPLHRRKAAREVRRRILSGRFGAIWNPPPPQPAMGPPQGSIWVPGWLHESAGSFVIPVGVVRRFGGAGHPSLARAENGPAFAENRRKPWQIADSHLKMAPYLAPRGTNVLGGVS